MCSECLRKERILLFFVSSAVSGSDEIVEKCICILQNSCINVHSIEGKDYIAALPFQVSASPFFHKWACYLFAHCTVVGRRA